MNHTHSTPTQLLERWGNEKWSARSSEAESYVEERRVNDGKQAALNTGCQLLKKCAVKGAGLLWVQLSAGNWFAPSNGHRETNATAPVLDSSPDCAC